MPSQKSNATHKNEYIYKIPFIEYERMLYAASKIRRRIVMALIFTNAIWLVITAFIMSKK
jgi:biotin synthase-like enzyme